MRTSVDVVLSMIERHPSAERFEFVEIAYSPPLEQRADIRNIDRTCARKALLIKKKMNYPFWDSVMLTATSMVSPPSGLLNAALYHQGLVSRRAWIKSSQLNLSKIRSLLSDCPEDKLIAITSRVGMRTRTVKHIPMLDFHIEHSRRSLFLIKSVVKALGENGILLCSGKSYHFYGYRLLRERELRVFLGRALLFSPIVDRAWISHQLIEGCCALRVSRRVEYGGPPRIICEI